VELARVWRDISFFLLCGNRREPLQSQDVSINAVNEECLTRGMSIMCHLRASVVKFCSRTCGSQLSASRSGIINAPFVHAQNAAHQFYMQDPIATPFAMQRNLDSCESTFQLFRLLGVECLILGVPTGLAASGLKKGTRSNS
jgi:hypothetical protein